MGIGSTTCAGTFIASSSSRNYGLNNLVSRKLLEYIKCSGRHSDNGKIEKALKTNGKLPDEDNFSSELYKYAGDSFHDGLMNVLK